MQSPTASSSTASRALSPRAVLGELNSFPRPAPVSPSSSSPCKAPSPTSGTIAVGVGLPTVIDAADKENVAPIFDSALHRPSPLHPADDEDDDEEDVFAAIERLRREREGDVEEEEEERKVTQRLDEADLDYDPFDSPQPPVKAVTSHAAPRPNRAQDRSAVDGAPLPTSLCAPSATLSASPPPASVLVLQSSFSHPSPSPRSSLGGGGAPVVEERVSADADVGGSSIEHLRQAAARKKAKTVAPPSSNRAISSFFASKPTASAPSSLIAAPLATPAQPGRASMPYTLPPSRLTSSALDSKKRRREEMDTAEERRSPPRRPAEVEVHSPAKASTADAKEPKPQREQTPAVEAASEKFAEEVVDKAEDRQVKGVRRVELFTADEDDDEDEGESGVAADDIEAQLMGEEEAEGPSDIKEPDAEGDRQAQHATTDEVSGTVDEVEGDAAGEGEGEGEEEEGGGDIEGEEEEVGGNEEEILAAALLDEAVSDDDDSEERRRAARNLPTALTADLSPSHRSTSSDSDSDEEDDEDWQALQAEDDQQRKVRLDALHATTERLIRSSAAAADALKAIVAPRPTSALEEQRTEPPNPMYAQLLERLREKEKLIGAEVGVRFIHESVEDEKRRVKQQQREQREEEQRRVVVVEREVDGERMLEIDLDELEDDVDDSDEDEGEEEADGDDDSAEDDQRPPEMSAHVEAEPAKADTTPVMPLREVVAEVVKWQPSIESSPASANPRLSEVSTEEESDAAASPPSITPASHPPPSPSAVEEEVDLVDDDMDEETKAMVRAAQDRRRKRRRLVIEEERQAKLQRIEDAVATDNAIMDLASDSSPPPIAIYADSEATLPPSSSTSAPLPSFTAKAPEALMRRQSKLRKAALLDAEAEDEDVVEGRRLPDADDDDGPAAADEYEEDGFVTRDNGDSDAAAAERRAVDAALDAAKDREVVEALQAKFVTRTASKAAEGGSQQAQRTASTVHRRGSHGSGSSSPVNSPSPVPTPPVRSGSGIPGGGGLLDDDGRPSDEEEEEVDDNSSARRHKRALLQHRARLLKQTGASSPSPASSPLKSLSRFDLLDDASLSAASAHFPPLASPLHPPSRTITLAKHSLPSPLGPTDFTALHAQIARQRSVVRQNSFLADGTGWKGAGVAAGGAVGVGGGVVSGGVVSVKSVSLNRSYIFRRVSDEMNENCHSGKRESGGEEVREVKGKGKAAAPAREVAKTAVQGAAFLSSLARSKTTVTSVHSATLKRKNSALLTAVRPSMLRAVSDQ